MPPLPLRERIEVRGDNTHSPPPLPCGVCFITPQGGPSPIKGEGNTLDLVGREGDFSITTLGPLSSKHIFQTVSENWRRLLMRYALLDSVNPLNRPLATKGEFGKEED